MTRTNGLATASLVLGLAGIIIGVLAAIPAIILGHVARHQIRRTGERGSGQALAGLILGYFWVGLLVLVIFLFVAVSVKSGGAAGG